jgi:hypothetical protein
MPRRIASAGGIAGESPQHQSAIIGARGFGMKRRLGYKGFVILARSYEPSDGGFSAEVSIQEHDADGVMETEFYLPDKFPTRESAIEAGIQAGRRKIDLDFERGSVVVNG